MKEYIARLNKILINETMSSHKLFLFFSPFKTKGNASSPALARHHVHYNH